MEASEQAFATVDDYERRYGIVADREKLAEVLLDASRLIAAECAAGGVDAGAPEKAGVLLQVCRSVAARAMQSDAAGVPLGVTQFSQGAAGFSESWSMANPSAEVYMTKAERRALGLRSQAVAFVQAGGCS